MRTLGIDFGTKRVGAALGDPRGVIATPLEVYERKTREKDAAHYRELARRHEVGRIVVGLPVHASGREGSSATLARQWGRWLAEVTGLEVVFFDERYTTVDAEDALRSAGIKLARRRDKRDMLAAQILLQNYLDAGGPSEAPPAQALDDQGPETGA